MNQSFFYRRIFNSSINLETYDKEILKQLDTFPDFEHGGITKVNYKDLSYLEYFRDGNKKIANYQLTDLILFQIRNSFG